ncbi:MAG: methyltransferase [Saprospiraceae bacterium]|nr:methyltransferase [Saprospiraceae bacterium]
MTYIHGFSEEEQNRLLRQNEVLAPYIYKHQDFSLFHHLVEIGCGVGAQMITVLHQYPHLHLTGIELSSKQLQRAKTHLDHFPSFTGRFTLIEEDATRIKPRFTTPVDGAFMVWVLEHVPSPGALLANTCSWLPEGAPIWITEVYHPSFQVWPASTAIQEYWEDTLRYQRALGGDPSVGLYLANLLADAGFEDIQTTPHLFFLDQTRSEERAIMLAYWLNLMRSALHETLQAGYTTMDRWQNAEADMRDLIRNPEAVFYYSFIQATARRPV